MHAVILLYDPDSLPSRDSRFPDPEDDYLYCRCFPVLSQDANGVVIEYKGKALSVFKDQVQLIDDPGYKVGDAVHTLPPRSPRAGVVDQVVWHFKDREPKFFLAIDGMLWNQPYARSELARSGDR